MFRDPVIIRHLPALLQFSHLSSLDSSQLLLSILDIFDGCKLQAVQREWSPTGQQAASEEEKRARRALTDIAGAEGLGKKQQKGKQYQIGKLDVPDWDDSGEGGGEEGDEESEEEKLPKDGKGSQVKHRKSKQGVQEEKKPNKGALEVIASKAAAQKEKERKVWRRERVQSWHSTCRAGERRREAKKGRSDPSA
eukprot:760647-Hanusia_phi.AAC.10